MPRRFVVTMGWVLGIFLIAYAYAFISATTADSEQSGGCEVITTAITSRHAIPPSVSEPGKPAVFCDFGVHFPLLRSYYSVFIYRVLDRREQDSILTGLRNFPREDRAHKILVQFFEKENWKTWSDPASGQSGGSRGRESRC